MATKHRMGAVEGWVVTHDGETVKAGFASDLEAARWLHRRHSYSVDHAVKHEGYDIVLVREGKVEWSYKRDVLGKGRRLSAIGAKRDGRRRQPRPTAQALYEAVALDLFPDSPAVLADFWIASQEHYEALYYPIRAEEISLEDLDRVLGDPKAITELVNRAPSNPHKGIVFG